MAFELRLFDEEIGTSNTSGGTRKTQAARLKLVADNLTVDEVIAERVKKKWEEGQQSANKAASPTRAELVANLEMASDVTNISLENAIKAAQESFRNGEFLFFWNEEQIIAPDTRLNILGENEAVFLRLFPMKGG